MFIRLSIDSIMLSMVATVKFKIISTFLRYVLFKCISVQLFFHQMEKVFEFD